MNSAMNFLWNRKWIWCCLLLSAAILFSYLQPLQFDEGGETTFLSMLMLILIGYFFGAKEAVVTALLFGFLKYVIDYHSMNNLAEFMDYMLGYGILCVGGIIAYRSKNLLMGYSVGVFLRYIESVINCIYFYYRPMDTVLENVWEGFSYSASYVLTEYLLTMFVLMFPIVREAIEYWKYVATHEKKENLNTY